MAKGKKTGGRKKGTPNKKTIATQELLEKLGCNPIEELWKLAQGAGDDKELAFKCYKELASYVAPKLKAVELSGEVKSTPNLLVALRR